MNLFGIRRVAVVALGVVALTSPSPAAASSCSDRLFAGAALAALAQRNEAISEAYLENYASAKADAFVGWRAVIGARVPCDLQLRKVRAHLLRNLGALWLSYAARAAGDVDGGLALLVAASKEAVLADAVVSVATRSSRAAARVEPSHPSRRFDP